MKQVSDLSSAPWCLLYKIPFQNQKEALLSLRALAVQNKIPTTRCHNFWFENSLLAYLYHIKARPSRAKINPLVAAITITISTSTTTATATTITTTITTTIAIITAIITTTAIITATTVIITITIKVIFDNRSAAVAAATAITTATSGEKKKKYVGWFRGSYLIETMIDARFLEDHHL
ncbi:hypothetical protein A0J61_11568 [Choanephora cucurbitarum]|uniref:Uncharacterized protein n=1 Tax=Choanephora cucurbitarum TaxID=101091 RepID=A0A1C7MU70_9FUNG|nr:hypothetical protein A0J61_11568 [Choanephora cucurbitarum]